MNVSPPLSAKRGVAAAALILFAGTGGQWVAAKSPAWVALPLLGAMVAGTIVLVTRGTSATTRTAYRMSFGRLSALIAIAGFVLTLGLTTSLTGLISHLPLGEPSTKPWLLAKPGPVPLSTVLILCVVSPMVEELAFRGFLLSSLDQGVGRRRAVVATMLSFALMHAADLRLAFFIPISTLLTATAIAADSIVASAIVHAAVNAALILGVAGPLRLAFEAALGVQVFVAAVCAALLVLGLRSIGRGGVVVDDMALR